jgi:hypothetical protein
MESCRVEGTTNGGDTEMCEDKTDKIGGFVSMTYVVRLRNRTIIKER